MVIGSSGAFSWADETTVSLACEESPPSESLVASLGTGAAA
jgi:hypothetical protein